MLQFQPAASFQVFPMCSLTSPCSWSCCDQSMQFLGVKYATGACLLWLQLLQQGAPLWCVPAAGRREGSCCSGMCCDWQECLLWDGLWISSLYPNTAHSCLLPPHCSHSHLFRLLHSETSKMAKKIIYIYIYTYTQCSALCICFPIYPHLWIWQSSVPSHPGLDAAIGGHLAVTLSNPQEPGHEESPANLPILSGFSSTRGKAATDTFKFHPSSAGYPHLFNRGVLGCLGDS